MSHAITIKVRGYHLDLYRHVNNARYLEFLEEARWSFLETRSDLDVLEKSGYAFAVVNINISYRRAAYMGEMLRINTAILQSRRRTEANPALNRPGVPGLLDAVLASQSTNPYVNAVLLTLAPGHAPDEVAESIRRWQRLTVYTRAQMEGILVGKLIATSARQIGMFLVILAVVSAAIVAFIIYTLTMDKIREIAVLKLIGTRNRTIAAMILQQAVALGLIGFVVGKIAATWSAPFFPKYVLLVPADTVAGFAAVMAICVLASLVSIRLALRVDPAEAIGG